MDKELKPCPFCGSTTAPKMFTQEELWDEKFSMDLYTICCQMDAGGCGATCGFHWSAEKTIERWNRRA